MSLWNWVLAAYERPGVAECCLKLQDEFGQNTSLLLWAIWARANDPGVLARAVEATRRWDATALQPLRAVRRALKAPCPPVADEPREALREEVKAAELRAERVLVETLERLGGEGSSGASALAALKTTTQAFGGTAPEDALAALAAAIG